MTDQQALLASIRESPADDAPRLVYADWLDENGQDARAAFVRTQIERHRLPTRKTRWHNLARKEIALLDQHGQSWLRPIVLLAKGKEIAEFAKFQWHANTQLGSIRSADDSMEWERGFVARVATRPEHFAAHAEAAFAAEPFDEVKISWLTESPATVRRALGSAEWRHVRHLELVCDRFSDGVERLIGSPNLGPLESLEMFYPTDNFNAVWDSPHLTRLKTLAIGQLFENGQLVAFARSSLATRLRSLEFGFGPPGFDGFRELIRTLARGHIEELRVRFLYADVEELRGDDLAQIFALPHLRRLALEAGLFAADAVAALDRAPVGRISSLDLTWSEPAGGWFDAILAHPLRRGLTEFSLPIVEIDERRANQLIAAFPAGQLRILRSRNPVAAAQLARLKRHLGRDVVQR